MATEVTAKGSEQTTVIASIEEQEKAKLQRDVERARKTVARLEGERAKAPPGVRVGMTIEDDPRVALRKLYVPESLGKNATMTAYFDSPGDQNSTHKKNVAMGWEPVIHDGEQVRHNADLMYKRPKWLSDEHKAKAREISQRRVSEKAPEELAETEAAGLLTGDGTKITSGETPA